MRRLPRALSAAALGATMKLPEVRGSSRRQGLELRFDHASTWYNSRPERT